MTGQYSGLLYILVEAGIIRKEAMPSYSELLMAVKTLAETTSKAEQKDKCPDCEQGFRTANDGTVSTCTTCYGTGEKKLDMVKLPPVGRGGEANDEPVVDSPNRKKNKEETNA